MTRKAFLKKYFMRFAVSVTLVGLMLYTMYHVFGRSGGDILTTPVRRITDMEILDGEGYLFREENVLTVSSPVLIRDLAESGSKVGSGGALVEVYPLQAGGSLRESQLALEGLERMIGILEESLVESGTTLSKAEQYRAEAISCYRSICAAAAKGEFSALSELSERMLILLNRSQALTDPSFDVNGLLNDLRAERAALIGDAGRLLKNGGSSGYFYRYDAVDGYESLFTLEALEGLTAESFADLRNAEPSMPEGFSVGKTVHGNRWYLAVSFGADAVPFVEAEERYTFTFPENRDKQIGMDCRSVKEGEDGGIIAVFASDEVPPDFVWKRSQRVEITVGSTTGYYVPDSALHQVDGVDGVYIFESSTVYFRRVEILYRGDGYCIVAEQSEGDSLAQSDLMITFGDGLYDGRVLE